MKKKFFFASLLIASSHPAFALFCPNGFNQIEFGDTIEHVQSQCGKPDKQTESKEDLKAPQQWQYYVKPAPTKPGTLNMTIAFAENKVINITVNGTSVMTTPICGTSVSAGDSTDKVKSACGQAAFINKGVQTGSSETTTTEFTYNTNPKVVFIFEDGKLKQRK